MTAVAPASFVYTGLPGRVVFGSGTLVQARAELERLGVTRALVLTTPAQVEQGRALVELLGDRAAGAFHGAAMHTPIAVTNEALGAVRQRAAHRGGASGG